MSDLIPAFFNIHTHHQIPTAKDVGSLYNMRICADSSPLAFPFSAGVHPWDVKIIDVAMEKVCIDIWQNKDCWVIGECGLDKISGKLPSDWNLQLHWFRFHLKWASFLQKPLLLHVVKSQQEVLKELQLGNYGGNVCVHGFNGKAQELDAYMRRKYFVSPGRHIRNSETRYREFLQYTFPDFLLLETDDDAALPIQEVYVHTARVLQISLDELQGQLYQNVIRYLGRNSL